MRLSRWVKNLLGQYQWYRRSEPGHWEKWTLPRKYGEAWFKVSACFYVRGQGPDPRLHGKPLVCEHYWDKHCAEIYFDDIYDLPDIVRCPVCNELIGGHPRASSELHTLPVYKICTGQLIRTHRLPKSGIPFPDRPG